MNPEVPRRQNSNPVFDPILSRGKPETMKGTDHPEHLVLFVSPTVSKSTPRPWKGLISVRWEVQVKVSMSLFLLAEKFLGLVHNGFIRIVASFGMDCVH
jgi:hypothetical protein